MNLDLTRPGLFRALFSFLLLYALFRCREWLGDGPVLFWREAALFSLTFFCAFTITRILSRNLIYLERTFLPMILFPLTAFGCSTAAVSLPALGAAALIVFAADQVIKAYRQETNFGFFLNASVALGAAALIWPPTVVFFGLLPVGFVLFRQNWRGVVTALAGYVFPVALYSYIQWGMGRPFPETAHRLIDSLWIPSTDPWILHGTWEWGLAGAVAALTLFGFVAYFRGPTKIRRRALRGFAAFCWMLLFAGGMLALPCRSAEMLPVAAVPLAALLPAAFTRRGGWLPGLLYFLLIAVAVAYHLFQILPLVY